MEALRWSSVPYCLAALALAAPSVERTRAADQAPPLELATPSEIAEVMHVDHDDPPPPEVPPHRMWTGPCSDQSRFWKGPMKIALDVTPPDGRITEQLVITGELAFVGRRARLSTMESDAYDPEARGRTLGGAMTEIGGLGTEWDVFLVIDRVDAKHLEGVLLENVRGPSINVICRFEWHR
jgi:hypothetical protein